MSDVKRGDDAADHAPKPDSSDAKPPASSDKQDAPNHEDRVDGGRAEPVETINAANDA
jgi:hypothetical protein